MTEHDFHGEEPEPECPECEAILAEGHADGHERLVPGCPLCDDYLAEMTHLYRGVVALRGDDPVFRAEMRDAGRGDLLR